MMKKFKLRRIRLSEITFSNEFKFTMLFSLVYFTSYVTRLNYSVVLIDISQSLNISNSLASLPVSLSYITYGAGQIVAGYLGDKFNSVKVITAGLALTALMNLSVAFANSIYPIMVFWTINGFAQALLWPPLVKIMLSVFENEKYIKCCSYVTVSASVATVLLYLVIPVFISFFSYKLIFAFSAIFAGFVIVLWNKKLKNIPIAENRKLAVENKDFSIPKLIRNFNLIPIFIIILLQGMLRDGITTWTPAFISENFNQPSSVSIFTTTVLPVFSIVAITITRHVAKRQKNEVLLSAFYWCFAVIFGVVLILGIDNMFISIAALTLLTSCMYSINLLFIGSFPARFVKVGKISTVSGLLNSFTYVGSTISAYLIARISETMGWNFNFILWVAISAIGGILCFAFNAKSKKAKKALGLSQQ